MKVSREQVAENRRRILDAAAQLFRERGFEQTTNWHKRPHRQD